MKKIAIYLLYISTPFLLYSQNSEDLYESIKNNYNSKNWDLFHLNRLKYLKEFENETKIYARVLEYSGAYFRLINKQDSAYYYYYKCHKTFETLKDTLNSSKMLLNLAIIQKNSRDYSGSESSSFKALQYLKKTNQKRIIASLYNNLGIVYNYSEQYENSLEYHLKALELRKTLKGNENLVLHSLNNIGNLYREQKKFDFAIKSFKKGLESKDLLKINPRVYSMLLDNLGYTYLLEKDYNYLPDLFFKAKKIRDSINDIPGKIRSLIHIGSYYRSLNNNKKAQNFYERALELSREIKNIEDELETLNLLSTIYPEQKSLSLLKRIIFIKDSIYKNERKLKEGITKVEFDTEEKNKENLQLKSNKAKQELLIEKANNRNWILGFSAFVFLIIAFFIWKRFKDEAKAKQIISDQKDLVIALQKELHHRMKNNLAFVDVFINLAKGKFKNEAYQTKLNELQNRLNSMFEIHKQLFNSEDITQIKANDYLNELIENIEKAYDNKNIEIKNITDQNEKITANNAFPVGLILNEFITNSYKYAFEEQEKGEITIDLSSDESNYVLKLKDNGKGLPKDLNISQLNSFGLEIIQLLTQEYNGEFEIISNNGVQMKIVLPKKLM